MDILRKQGERDSVKLACEEDFEKSLPEITFQLKWLVARDLWNVSEAMLVYNQNDDFFKKGYAIIRERKLDKVLTRKVK